MSKYKAVSDEILVGWCARDVGGAWLEFWDRFSEWIYDFGRRRFKPYVAEPGDFYLYVRRRLNPRRVQSFDPARGIFRFWFHRVLENFRADFLRETSVRRTGITVPLDEDKIPAPHPPSNAPSWSAPGTAPSVAPECDDEQLSAFS